MSLNLAHYLDISAQRYPEKTALMLDEFRMTYRDLAVAAKRVAHVLRDKGVKKGDKVAMMIPNVPYFPAIYYGILNVGATVVPVNTLLKSQEIQYYLEDSDAVVFFTWKDFYGESAKAFNEANTCQHLIVVTPPGDIEVPLEAESFADLVESAPATFEMVQTMPDDTAVILYTSGTTGHPKGAELTHFNMFFNALCTKDQICRVRPDDVGLVVLPLFHSFGQTCLQNTCLLAGATMTLLTQFQTEKALEVIQRDKVSFIAAVPTMYFFMLHANHSGAYDLSSIRMAVSGGAALPVEILHQFEQRFSIRILEGYGLSETSPVASFNLVERPSKPGSIGLPIWGCDMKIMREDGTFAEIGEVGEIVVRGHNIMKGYYKKPLATAEAIVDGWFHTGDLAKVDEEGYFFIVDRKKDLIIRGGMNVYPREIEEVLYAHPAILEASVVGIPDEARGEEIKAYVALKPGVALTDDEIKAYCLERMARFKCPKEVEILPTLPKGPTGKILKRELRLRHAAKTSAT
ncbi:MAG: long-chain fatty acid--CoA ligase [Candidatus Hydrogenedentes bacterium]|nr:long-chain fatty acid--CoA ligase [Candidatus Hydrogenedentota bacterium]